MHRTWTAAVCWIVIGLTSGCRDSTKPQTIDARIVTLFGGEANLRPVLKPLHVEAFRVSDRQSRLAAPQGDVANSSDAGGAAAEKSISGWPILAGPIAVDAKTAAELSVLFSSSDTYQWEWEAECKLQPGVGLRFTDDSGSTEILLCFVCDQIAMIRDGELVGHQEMGKSGQLVAISQRLFPDDAEIQAIGKP